MQYMEDHRQLPGFRHSNQIIAENGFNMNCGLVDAFTFSIPLVDTDVFLNWLMGQCMSNGVYFVREALHGPLRTQCDSLKNKYKAQYIVNCTGINARELAEDNDVYPMTGAALIVNTLDVPFQFPRFGIASSGPPWEDKSLNVKGNVVIVSRGDHSLWLGTIEHESYETNLDVQHPFIRRMLQELQTVYPPLKNIPEDKFQLVVGIRPMRRGTPRVEQDPYHPSIIHNYGHCGQGIILSWGCAEDVLGIIKKSQSLGSKL